MCEFKAVMYDAVARNEKGVLPLQSFLELMDADTPAVTPATGTGSLYEQFSERLPTLKEAETFLIDTALQRTNGNQGMAAAMLGMSRQALNKRLLRRKQEVA